MRMARLLASHPKHAERTARNWPFALDKNWRHTYRKDCYLCNAPLGHAPLTLSKTDESFLCLRCLWQIDWVIDAQNFFTDHWEYENSLTEEWQVKHCQRCGIQQFAAQFGQTSEPFCPSCLAAVQELQKAPGFQLTRGFPLAYYQGLFAKLLQWYKFSRELPVAGFFASLLQRAYQKYFSGYYLVPVPPRARKLKREAWDQITYLSGVLQRHYRLPVLKLLERKAGSAEQKQQNRQQRLGQVDKSYELALHARRLAWGQFRKSGPLRLLLLDDVYTTGATVAMCRRALQDLETDGWVSDVRALNLCVVPQHSQDSI